MENVVFRPLQRHVACSTPANFVLNASAASPGYTAQDVLNTRRQMRVLDSTISYLDTGVGDNVVIFLHGNPTAAYLWRDVIPHVSPVARCLAPDLIGMGRSGKEPNNSYRFVDHYRYLAAWIDHMTLPQKITIVGHDWGSALGFHWCNLHRDRVKAIVFMEALVDAFPTWDNWPESARVIFQMLRTNEGDTAVLENNMFVEGLLPSGIIRQLSNDEMEEYLRPYLTPGESRRPTLTWPREIPIASVGPEDVVRFARDYHTPGCPSREICQSCTLMWNQDF